MFGDSSISVSAPVLVLPDTKYSETIPLIIGNNVIRYFKGHVDEDISAHWQDAFSVPVKSFIKKPVVIRPFESLLLRVAYLVLDLCLFV